MIDINVVSFLLFDMLIVGLSITAFRDLKQQSKFHNYWRLSLLCFAVGYLLFGLSPYFGNQILGVANYFVVTASLSMTLLMRTWNQPVGKVLERSLFAATLLVPVVFEVMMRHGSHIWRVTFIMALLLALSLWRIYELRKLQLRQPNAIVKVMLVLALIYAVLSVGRLIIVWLTSGGPHTHVFNEGFIAVVNRWGLSATHVMTYLAINEFYTEKSWQREKEALEAQLQSQQIIHTLSREVDQATQLNKNLAFVLSEKNKLLSSLSSSMKSTRMGAMASSMAHEINQPLSALRLNAEMVQADLQKAPGLEHAKSNIGYLIEDADRIGAIVNKIKQFFYNDHSDYKDLQLSVLVDDTFDYVLEDCKRARIDVVIDIDSKLRVHGDKGQLQMVVFNLISNAQDELKRKEGMRSIIVRATVSENHIDLEVQDNGSGVPAEIADQIFDLFHTSKPEGMGVGLWLSRAVMENHRGQLTYSNMPEGGARFVMQFPAPVAQV
jgi:signal transduction histidine kinase